MLKVAALGKSFGKLRALDNVGFSVGEGEILGVLGANGAGKSTLISILAGLLEPDTGDVEIFQRRFRGHRASILAQMNIASPYASLPGQLTVRENLSIYAGLYGVRRPRPRIEELLRLFGISAQADTRFARLSSGQAVRANLCKALLNAPRLLLLDEPTVYLDPEIAIQARTQILRERDARGMAILLTSHNLLEIEHLCDRVLLLKNGSIAAYGTTLEVTRHFLGGQRKQAALDEVFAHLVRSDR